MSGFGGKATDTAGPYTISEGEVVLIPENQQLISFGEFIIEGQLFVDGLLIEEP